MSIQNADAEYMQPIFDYLEDEERKKPRVNCPKHGEQLVCAVCRKCINCITEEQQADNLAYCRKERHTFLNLSAPCKYCRYERGGGISHSHSRTICGNCFLLECIREDDMRRKRRRY
jgi:hypothetical protein